MSEKPKTTRLYFVDTLRVTLTMLVIAHHAGTPYGPAGGGWPVSESRRTPLLGPFFAVNPMFFMGLFFLLAGYFAAHAVDRRGAIAFVKGRLRRLGIPLLVFMLLVSGPITYLDQGGPFAAFVAGMYRRSWTELYRHLWFVGHLLLYSLVYALWRALVRRRVPPKPPLDDQALSLWRTLLLNAAVLLYALALAWVTYVVRQEYPLDRWRALLFVLPAEIAHLPQYVSLFVGGLVAYRGNWLRRFPTASGLAWLAVGGSAAVLFYLRELGLVSFLPRVALATGGRTPGAQVFSAWEALICTGLCVGLPVLFREVLNRKPGRLLSAAIEAQYAAYILHVPLVIGAHAALKSVAWQPLIKFGIATGIGAGLSFGVGWLLRRVPGVKRVL